jgi:hypothetical protein
MIRGVSELWQEFWESSEGGFGWEWGVDFLGYSAYALPALVCCSESVISAFTTGFPKGFADLIVGVVAGLIPVLNWGLLACVIFGIGPTPYEHAGRVVFLLALWAFAGAVGLAVFFVSRAVSRSRERRARLYAAQRQVVNRLSSLAADTEQRLAELPRLLSGASSWIAKADGEFKQHAFSPFWDAVEQAAIHIGKFNNLVNQIVRDARQYYDQVSSLQGSMPAFPVDVTRLPDPHVVVRELQRVVRMGQTDYQFASIWEHRRTRAVMIAGFRTLDEGLSHIEAAVSSSMASLEDTLSSGLRIKR